MKHRNAILALSVLGVLASWFLPHVVLAIHAAHGMATVHELHSYRLVDEDRLDEVRTEIGDPNYSVGERVRSVGATHIYLPIVSYILMGLFAAICILVWLSTPVGGAADAEAIRERSG